MKSIGSRIRSILLITLLIITASNAFAEEHEADVAETLFHHILNSPEMELLPGLPKINLPGTWTVHQLMLVLAVFLLSILFLLSAKKKNLKPKKLAISIEALVLFVRDDLVYPIMGEETGKKWLSFFTTLFLFTLTLNILGLIPAFKTATGNINVTISLAVLVLILTFIHGIKEIGFGRFLKNMYPEGSPLLIGIFVFILEVLSLFTKSAVLGLRLFVNMFAGHMAILSFLILIFVITPLFSFISVPFAVFTYTLEVLIAFIQALVFTLLSCIFISMAASH